MSTPGKWDNRVTVRIKGGSACEPLAQLLEPQKWGLLALVTVPIVEATRPPGAHLADPWATRRSRGPQPGWWVPLGLWGLWGPCPKWPGKQPDPCFAHRAV